MTQEIDISGGETWYKCVDPMSKIELWLPEDEFEEISFEGLNGHIVRYQEMNRGFFVSDGGRTDKYLFRNRNVTTHPESEVPDQ